MPRSPSKVKGEPGYETVRQAALTELQLVCVCVCREKAVFSLQAHVFQIDPETKKKWLPSSTSSVRVAFYHDPGKKTYRIIAIENNKVISLTHHLCCVRRRCEHSLCVVRVLYMSVCDVNTVAVISPPVACKLLSQVQPP